MTSDSHSGIFKWIMASSPHSDIKVRVYVTKDLGNVVTDEENRIFYRNGMSQLQLQKLKAVSGTPQFDPTFKSGDSTRLYQRGTFVWPETMNDRHVKLLNSQGTKVQRAYHLPKEAYDAAVKKLQVQEQRYAQRIQEIVALYAPKIERLQKRIGQIQEEKSRKVARLRKPRLRLEALVK